MSARASTRSFKTCSGATYSARATIDPKQVFGHYLDLLERNPDRFDLEQTHLFAAMDFAHASSDLDGALRIDRLLRKLGGVSFT